MLARRLVQNNDVHLFIRSLVGLLYGLYAGLNKLQNEQTSFQSFYRLQTEVFQELKTFQGRLVDCETERMSDTSLDKVTTSYGWFSFRPKWLQSLNKPWCFLIVISIAAFFQGAIINGFVNVSLTSIETRFGLSSQLVGIIPPSYDIGGFLSVIPIAYVGGRVSQTRILGICLFIAAVGAAIMCLPHLITLSEPSPMDALKDFQANSIGFCGDGNEVSIPSTW